MATFLKHILALLICLIQTGCSALTGISGDYPKSWPLFPPTSSKDCPNLSGKYQNLATYSFLPAYEANSLSRRLGLATDDVKSITLTHSLNTLTIETLDNKNGVDKLVLSQSANDFTCSDGAITLPPVVVKAGDGTGGYRSTRRLFLWRAADGSLVGEDKLFSVGALLWLVPIVGGQTFWYRWSLLNES